jgi:glycosyltransferase involved in cell wall biosynthesis
VTVAILSDSPALTTGFGRTTARIAGAIASRGADVACFGLRATPGSTPPGLPYQIWAAERGGHWSVSLPAFFASARPNVLLLNVDIYNAAECVRACRDSGWAGPTVSYVCIDGLPVSRPYLDVQRACAAVWCSSRTGAAYLRGEGVSVAGVAAPGVDTTVFRPDPCRGALRDSAGLTGATVVGVFATNTERKQIDRAVTGFALATRRMPRLDLRLYLHCRPRGYSDLARLASEARIGERVVFPAESFDEDHGVPTTTAGARAAQEPSALAGPPGTLPRDLSYVERINCCDVLLNVPHSGDYEQVILEGQACGVPLIHTDDDGIMAEAFGDGAVKLPAAEISTGPAGGRLCHPSPEHIAEALERVITGTQLRARLRTAGLANAACYPWEVLEDAACAMAAPYTE